MANAGEVRGTSGGPSRAAQERERPVPPREGDAEKFGRLVGREGGRDKSARAEVTHSAGGADSLAELLRQAASANLPGVALPAGSPTQSGAVAEASAAASLDRARCDELVDRILVSQPDSAGREEVRLRLDQSWLPDTEVRLSRGADGGLTVEFVSDQLDSQRFLLPNLSSLRERLAERTGDEVMVRMSENLPDSGADTGDGRSRNRRNLFEEMSEGNG